MSDTTPGADRDRPGAETGPDPGGAGGGRGNGGRADDEAGGTDGDGTGTETGIGTGSGSGDDGRTAVEGTAGVPPDGPARIDDRPTRTSAALATVAALAAAAAALRGGALAGTVAGVGAALVSLAGATGNRRALGWGASLGFGGVLLSGATGGSAAATVAGAVAVLFAWDVTDHGIDLGGRVGRAAATARNEAAHAAGSLAVGGLSGALGYAVYVGAAGGRPVTALVALAVGAILLAAALND